MGPKRILTEEEKVKRRKTSCEFRKKKAETDPLWHKKEAARISVSIGVRITVIAVVFCIRPLNLVISLVVSHNVLYDAVRISRESRLKILTLNLGSNLLFHSVYFHQMN